MEALPIFVRLAGQPALLVGDGEAAGGRIVRAVAPGVRLAFVALDDEVDAAGTTDALMTARLLVNVVDRSPSWRCLAWARNLPSAS